MGLEVKRNDKGEYQLISTISDGPLHEAEWISEEEAKRILIYQKLWRFIESVIEIDMSFPKSYCVNDVRGFDLSFNEFMLKSYKSEDFDKVIQDKFTEVYNRLKLEIQIP